MTVHIRSQHRRRRRAAGNFGYVLTFAGTGRVDCGSGATLDDIPAAGNVVTVDCWFMCNAASSGSYAIVGKGNTGGVGGWLLFITATNTLTLRVDLDTTDVNASHATTVRDSVWRHVAACYNDATKKGRVAVNGVWGTASTGAGNYISDTANALMLARLSTTASWYLTGGLAWVRVSNNDRFDAAGGASFSPPAKCTPPAADANTVELWALDEGAGSTAAASVTPPTNNGTITNGTWAACT